MRRPHKAVIANDEAHSRAGRGAGRYASSLLFLVCAVSLRGLGSRRKVENTCSNESVPETLESLRVTSSLDITACSKSTDNKFFRTEKSLTIEQNYNRILTVKWK